MNSFLIEKTKMVAYFLWEETKHDDALALWLCAEDIACFFEESDIFRQENVMQITTKSVHDMTYIQLIRHLSYRIFVYTNNANTAFNWFVSERLIRNKEWCENLLEVSKIYSENKDNPEFLKMIKSSKVKNFYNILGKL